MPRDERIENCEVPQKFLLSPRFTPANIEARRAKIFAPHVRKLNQWVERARTHPRLPPGAGATIPWFDPRGGGVTARVLFLMQDPSEVATFTGFISPDNNDRTANNSTKACAAAGLDGKDRVHWNVYPWWVNVRKKNGDGPVDPTRPPQTYDQARLLAREMLSDVLSLLPRLEVIVLLGNHAQDGYKSLEGGYDVPGRETKVLCCPSCSPQAWDNVMKKDPLRRTGQQITTATLRAAACSLAA